MGLGEAPTTVTNMDYKPVNPKDIPVNVSNNYEASEVLVTLDMVDNFNVHTLVQNKKNVEEGNS